MTATISKTATTMLWPDGRLDVPEEIRQALGISGGWECTIEVVDDSLVVRPQEQIPDEDLWAYTPEHLAELREALAEPVENDLRLSPRDLKDLMEGRITVDELQARSKQ
jgi:bifunctional DNA-binding transcriptional regulator/antitoxin component of YhaV-PrlF toxin-antitoxin module